MSELTITELEKQVTARAEDEARRKVAHLFEAIFRQCSISGFENTTLTDGDHSLCIDQALNILKDEITAVVVRRAKESAVRDFLVQVEIFKSHQEAAQ